jgi:hypothetical protein
MNRVIRAPFVVGIALALTFALVAKSRAGQTSVPLHKYQVLAPITQGNLTVFPVIASASHDTSEFLTLDEGLRAGDVVVTEAGQRSGMIRRRGTPLSRPVVADVNHLFIVNNSKRPLVLLAGEIVTGGKQDRIVGKDRIIPAGSDADLDVFCVEPGRWTEVRGASGFAGGFAMAKPSVRNEVMASKSQQGVWDQVNRSNMETVEVAAAPEARSTSSYARVMENEKVRKEVDKVAEPIERSYRNLLGELRERKALGVVVAVNGDVVWADIFASSALLEKYWPKLVRSYAAEAMTQRTSGGAVDLKEAQAFLSRLDGTHEQTDTEPGVYRHTEITGSGYKVFELTSLLPGRAFDVHISKMAE